MLGVDCHIALPKIFMKCGFCGFHTFPHYVNTVKISLQIWTRYENCVIMQ